MKVTSYNCAGCGGNVPVNNLVNNVVCPHCKRDFYIDPEWERSVKVTIENTKQILIKNIRNVDIPKVKEKIVKKDLHIFKKVNESIVFLDKIKFKLNNNLIKNKEEIKNIEYKVGLDYKELIRMEPEIDSFIKNLGSTYIICSSLIGIIAMIYFFSVGHPVTAIFGSILIGVLWPIAFFMPEIVDGMTRLIIILLFAIIILLPITIFLYQFHRKNSFLNNFDESKKILDLERIETRKLLSKENARLSLNIELLHEIISELTILKSSANILKNTNQFDGLTSIDIIKKIEFSSRLMQEAKIEFEVACENFIPNNVTYESPFFEYDYDGEDIEFLIQEAINHVYSD